MHRDWVPPMKISDGYCVIELKRIQDGLEWRLERMPDGLQYIPEELHANLISFNAC